MNRPISSTVTKIIDVNPTRMAYEFRVRYEGHLKAGDYYTMNSDGEKTLVSPDQVVSTIESGKPVFMSVGSGKCRELSLRVDPEKAAK